MVGSCIASVDGIQCLCIGNITHGGGHLVMKIRRRSVLPQLLDSNRVSCCWSQVEDNIGLMKQQGGGMQLIECSLCSLSSMLLMPRGSSFCLVYSVLFLLGPHSGGLSSLFEWCHG